MKKRLFAGLLALMMILSVVPMNANATEQDVIAETQDGYVLVHTYEELLNALEKDSAKVRMTADIEATATENSGYGKAGVLLEAGDVLDGDMHKLTINGADTTWDCVVAMEGGEVRNLTVSGAFRGIFMPGASGDVIIDNCVLENVTYTFNSDAGSKDYTVTIKNTTLNGWTSFSNVHKSVTFENCKFGKGNGYAFCRPYQGTTFSNCDFANGFGVDTRCTDVNTLVFNACKYNDEALSSENNDMFLYGGKVVIDDNNIDVTDYVAEISDDKFETLEEAFAAAAESDTIVLLADAAPALTSQRAITKAAVIDLAGKTLTLTEDDLYFGTTTFKNGNIVVDSSVKPSTAVFWMFANQTLTFEGVKLTATGVTGTYLIGLDGDNSDLNLLNGSEIIVNNETALDLDIICVNASTGNDIIIDNSKVDVTNLDGRVFFRGNYIVSGDSDIDLSGVTKAGFRIEAGQTLSVEDTATVDIEGEPRDGGIHLTDVTAKYNVADTATVNATVNKPAIADGETLQKAIDAAEAGGTIKLDDDIELTAGIEVNKEITLDLNGKKLSASDTQAKTALIKAVNGAKLTITGEGTVDSASQGNDYSIAVWAADGASVTIENGTFTNVGAKDKESNGVKPNNNELIYVSGTGEIIINGGTFIGNTENTTYGVKYTLNKQDNCAGTIKVCGGKYSGYDPSSSHSENPVGNFVVEGYEVVASGSNYIVGKHELKAVAGTSASCTGTGIKNHYKCNFCGKLYSDAAGTAEVTADSLVIAAKGHSFSSYASSDSRHWQVCSRCSATTDKKAHNYSNGVCGDCGYKTEVEVYVPETTTTTTTTTTPATSTTTTTQTTTKTDTTTTTETTATPSAEAAIPVKEVVVDTKIVEEVASEEVKAAVKETVVVTEEKAAVTTETVEKVIEKTETGATVILPLTEAAKEGQNVKEAEVPVEAIEKIVEAEAALTVEFEGVKVTFEKETLKAIAEQAQGSVIELRVVPIEHHELNEKQQATLEEQDVAVCVSAQIFSDGEYIGDFKGGKARIAIPFTPEEGKPVENHKVYFVDDNGEMTLMPSTYVDGYMVLETTHFSDYVIVYEEVAAAEETETVVEEAAVEEAPVEEVQEEAGLPIVPIIIIIVVVIAVVAFLLTKKKNDVE